eukprot:19522-Pyramimonas_sp.AAC.1
MLRNASESEGILRNPTDSSANPQRIRMESEGILAQTTRRSRPGSRLRASGIPEVHKRLRFRRES